MAQARSARLRRKAGAGRELGAVCFDLDGVLMDTMPLHARAWQEALRERGRSVARREIYAWEGERGLATARRLLGRGGRRLRPRAVAALLAEKERRFGVLARSARVDPRLDELLERLARSGLALGLVTGTSSGEIRRMLPRRVLAAFRAIVTGDQVRLGKPHPEPYRVAFRRLRVSAARALVIENAPYGIRAARRAGAGLIVALASSLPPRFLREADVTVSSAARLRGLLERLCLSGPSSHLRM